MSKIDIHLHLALESRMIMKNINISGAEAMIPHLAKLEIRHGILLSSGEKDGGNHEVMTISRKHPELFSWMCNVDYQNAETVFERIALYKQQGAVGVGEIIFNEYIDSPFVESVFEAAEKLELPILFHMSPEPNYNYGIIDKPGMPLLESALAKFPNLKIIGHSQPFWHEISGDADPSRDERNSWGSGPVTPGGRLPELLRKYPNLYGDLSANSGGSAIMRDEAFGLEFLETFQDKLLFGSDMCNADMEFPLGKWMDEKYAEGKITATAYEKICYGNAQRIFGIA